MEASPEDRELIKKACQEGRVTASPRVEVALACMDMKNPDFTIEEVEFMPFGPWKKGKHGSKGGFEIQWTTKSAGCGSTTFAISLDGKLTCDAECMSKEFIMTVLKALVDQADMGEKW